jgi:hypothetical protein
MKLFMIRSSIICLCFIVFIGCNTVKNKRFNKIKEETDFYYYVNTKTSTQSGIFTISYLKDSMFIHTYYDLSTLTPLKEDDKILADTFLIKQGDLMVRHNNEFKHFLRIDNFNERNDTMCNYNWNIDNCYISGKTYSSKNEKIYYFSLLGYDVEDNFGIEYNPKIGIVSYCQGWETLVLSKLELKDKN